MVSHIGVALRSDTDAYCKAQQSGIERVAVHGARLSQQTTRILPQSPRCRNMGHRRFTFLESKELQGYKLQEYCYTFREGSGLVVGQNKKAAADCSVALQNAQKVRLVVDQYLDAPVHNILEENRVRVVKAGTRYHGCNEESICQEG